MNMRLMRTWYKTDADPEVNPDVEDGYVGTLSTPIPLPTPSRQIVSVKWLDMGEVEVTWLVPA